MTFEEIVAKAKEKIAEVENEQNLTSLDVEQYRLDLFGKNGYISLASTAMRHLAKEKKPEAGKTFNQIKKAAEEAAIKVVKQGKPISKESFIDITAPGTKPHIGHLHPITQAIGDISRIFERIGFEISDTREIETDWYAFGALNFPDNHPARDEWETFFIDQKNVRLDNDDKVLLTPHTSSAQNRVMTAQQPPIRNITISKCYRRQADVSHLQMFHQFEGIFVDKHVSIANLKGVLDYFAQQYFGESRKTRIRPYDFRFTEPSFEVDISCANCNGKGCRVCKQGWLELGGAGMIHQNVLKAANINEQAYSGFAFGWGVERVWMMKGDISLPDIRQIYTNDLRFTNQF